MESIAIVRVPIKRLYNWNPNSNWSKGLTKDTDERVLRRGVSLSEVLHTEKQQKRLHLPRKLKRIALVERECLCGCGEKFLCLRDSGRKYVISGHSTRGKTPNRDELARVEKLRKWYQSTEGQKRKKELSEFARTVLTPEAKIAISNGARDEKSKGRRMKEWWRTHPEKKIKKFSGIQGRIFSDKMNKDVHYRSTYEQKALELLENDPSVIYSKLNHFT